MPLTPPLIGGAAYQLMAKPRAKHYLGLDKLEEVVGLLEEYGYDRTTYELLGIHLGLSPNRLKEIKAAQNDFGQCLNECLKAWIDQVDNVKKKGGPTYYALIMALQKIGQNRTANGIDNEKHPACAIFARYKEDKIIIDSLPQLAILLYKENLIEAMIVGSGSAFLNGVQKAICADYKNLEKFAAVLQLLDATRSVGIMIRKDSLKEFKFTAITDENGTGSSDKVIHRSAFDPIRPKFASFIDDATKAMSIIPQKDLKMFLRRGYPHLKFKLEGCEKMDDLLTILADECSLTNVSLLEAVADRFQLTAAKEFIQKYKEEVDKFCKDTLLEKCIGETISSDSLLKCETMTLSICGKVADYTFKDAEELVEYASGKCKPPVKITVIREDKSFTITCSFPLTLSEPLIASAIENLELLKKKGLLKLTVGYGVVYDEHEKEADATRIYVRNGILEQLLASKSIQLVNCCQEKKVILASMKAADEEVRTEKKLRLMKVLNEEDIFPTMYAAIYAAIKGHKHVLNVDTLSSVTKIFRKYHYFGTNYRAFGDSLNVPKDRLDFIENNFKGDLDRCLIECLMTWLRNPKTGEKTWEKLADALRDIDEDDLAEKICCEKFKACKVFDDYYLPLFETIDDPVKLASILGASGIIEHESVTKIEKTELMYMRTCTLLAVVQQSICRNNASFRHFAEDLKKLPATAAIGHEILTTYYHKEYETMIADNAYNVNKHENPDHENAEASAPKKSRLLSTNGDQQATKRQHSVIDDDESEQANSEDEGSKAKCSKLSSV